MDHSYFESLESRALMSAPVATVQSFGVTPDTMTLVVRYEADTGIDRSTIGTGDVGVTGPNVSRFAESAAVVSGNATSATVRYVLRRSGEGDHDQWPIGTYNLGIAADAVRSSDGAANAETGAGSYFLWYPNTVLELRSASLTGDGWSVQLTRWMRTPDSESSVTTQVRITGPHGSNLFQTTGFLAAHNALVTLRAENPDGLWDFTDTGTYTLDVATYYASPAPTGFQPTAQYWLWYTNPKVEILSTDFTDGDVLIHARFTDDHGIDASSITWSAIGIDVGPFHIGPTIDLYTTVDPQPDGSVLATLRRGMFQRPFTSRESGDWKYVTNAGTPRVRDIDGNTSSVGVIMHQQHTFTAIAPWEVGLSATPDDPTSLTLTHRFYALNVDLSSLGDDDARLEMNGHTYQLTLQSSRSLGGHDGNPQVPMYEAVYTVHLTDGDRLTSGTAGFYLNAGGLTVSGQANPNQFLGSWWLWFN
jgi:hypothetical protein